jgi:hypothetical protein
LLVKESVISGNCLAADVFGSGNKRTSLLEFAVFGSGFVCTC